MKRILSYIFVLSAIIYFAGCQSNANYRHLISTQWTLDEIVYDDSTYTITPPRECSIVFSDSTSMAGRGPCNNFFGVYNTDRSDQINIEVKGSTLAYCNEMEFEDRYIAILNLADVYSADSHELHIRASQNRVTLVFRPSFEQ